MNWVISSLHLSTALLSTLGRVHHSRRQQNPPKAQTRQVVHRSPVGNRTTLSSWMSLALWMLVSRVFGYLEMGISGALLRARQLGAVWVGTHRRIL